MQFYRNVQPNYDGQRYFVGAPLLGGFLGGLLGGGLAGGFSRPRPVMYPPPPPPPFYPMPYYQEVFMPYGGPPQIMPGPGPNIPPYVPYQTF